MHNDKVTIGEHCWAVTDGELLVVLKTDPEGYEVCGPWECGIGNSSQLEIIKIIKKPKGHINTKLYYLD